MLDSRCNSRFVLMLLCCLASGSAPAQETSRTVRHRSVPVEQNLAASALLDQAEGLLSKGDYAAAQSLLQQATTKDPGSYQGWYDLGYAEQGLNRPQEAIAAYRKSVEVNPKIFESNLNLGLALAASGQEHQAIKYLKDATELQPTSHPQQARERVWLAIGRIELKNNPGAAEQAFLQAAKVAGADPEPHLLLGELYENSGKLDQAKSHYQQVLLGSQGEARTQALRGLVNIAIAAKQYDEAESDVRQYLAAASEDAQAHLLLGRLLAAQSKNAEALSELDAAGSQSDVTVMREKAELLSALHRDADAIPMYRTLVEQNGNDAQLRYQYGLALMHQRQFPAAEEQLVAAVKLNPNLASAYGDLAVVASEKQQYDLALKALEIRTKLLGDNPGTYFLRATALDHLRRFPEATQNYRQFLSTANGKYPDEEWKARHRLLAIEKLK